MEVYEDSSMVCKMYIVYEESVTYRNFSGPLYIEWHTPAIHGLHESHLVQKKKPKNPNIGKVGGEVGINFLNLWNKWEHQ